MKKIVLILSLLSASLFSLAQDDEEKRPFKENLFTGGNVTVSFFNGTTILGASPIFGYKLANWVDAGIVTNFIYSGQRDYPRFNDKVRQTVYGGGVFTRLYPVNFLFIQGQLEHNFTRVKYIPPSSSYLPFNETVDASSFLVGAGYTQGRTRDNNTFYYVSVLFDVMKNENSPYVDRVYNEFTGEYSVRTVPIIRAGINIALFQGRNRGDD
jgi:hypothetical protein